MKIDFSLQAKVEPDIDSISLTPDRVIETTLAVIDLELAMGRAPRSER